MERRGFFKNLLSYLLYVLGGLCLAYPVLSFMRFRKSSARTVIFHPDEQHSKLSFKQGVYLTKHNNSLLALSAQCPHLGCILNFDQKKKEFHCPCHGSKFDSNGKRLAGPARTNMKQVPLTKKANGDIVVTLKI